MKHTLTLLILAALLLLLPSCGSRMPGVKAQKAQQEVLGKKFGRNHHAPNKFKRRHFPKR